MGLYFKEVVKVEYEFIRKKLDCLLEIAKQNKLSVLDKNEILKIVNNLEKRTEVQKRRFCILYNLYVNQKAQYSLSDIAREDGVRPSAVKQSVARVRNSLVNMDDEQLKKIIQNTKEIYISRKGHFCSLLFWKGRNKWNLIQKQEIKE